MRGTQVSPTSIFWHIPTAIDIGRQLFGAAWNPDNVTQQEADMIVAVIEGDEVIDEIVARHELKVEAS